MRKFFLFLLVLVMLLSPLLAACSPTATATLSPQIPVSTSAQVSTAPVAAPTVPSSKPGEPIGTTASTVNNPLSTITAPAVTTAAVNPTLVPTNLPVLPSQPKLTTAPAIIKTGSGKEVNMVIEVARSDQEHEYGLMGRYKLGENEGMIFIFRSITNGSFWMRNTPLPLSIAFISDKNQIVDIQDMQPLSEQLTTPKASYLYALEMNLGFFERNGIKVGDTFVLKN